MTKKQICISSLAFAAVMSAGCGDHFDATGIYLGGLTIKTMSDEVQLATPQSWLASDLHAQVVHIGTQEPVAGVIVHWRVVAGSDAELDNASSITDDNGIARARVHVGASEEYVIEASFTGLRNKPARFTLFASRN